MDTTRATASSAPGRLRVTRCETPATLAAASVLFEQYRHHYGQPPEPDGALVWLTEMVESRMLTIYTAALDSSLDRPTGLATSHAIPASLALGRSWQLRDLYVLPGSRGGGVAAALVGAVRREAAAAGATRLSLVTEPDNRAALGLYQKLGFETVAGLASLSLDLAPDAGSE